MTKLGATDWIIAGIVALALHGLALTSLGMKSPRQTGGSPGPRIEILGARQTLSGPDAAQPKDASPSPPQESEKTVSKEPDKAPPELEEKGEFVRDTRPPESSEIAKTVPAESETPQEAPSVEAEPEQPVEQTALVPPKPAKAPPKRVVRKTHPRPKARRTRPKPRMKRAETGAGKGRRRAGSTAAVLRKGAGQRRKGASVGAVRNYKALVHARIARNRPAGQTRTGTAVVAFALTRNGGLRFARLLRSSGNPALDRASLNSVRRSAPFPRPPKGMTAAQLRFAVPFHFR